MKTPIKPKTDKWCLKFSKKMKHAQRTEKYIRLTFNSYISDDYFFQKSMHIIDKEMVQDCQRRRSVP
jgi:hypothetical protein